MKLAIDTNAYRAFVDGDTTFVEAVQRADNLAFSVVVLGELRAGFRNGTRQAQNEQVLRRILASERVGIHEVGEGTSRIYAKLWAELRQRSRPLPTNDVWIAALCLENDFGLLTRDKHFAAVAGLDTYPKR